MNLSAGQDRDADVENGLADTVREGKGGQHTNRIVAWLKYKNVWYAYNRCSLLRLLDSFSDCETQEELGLTDLSVEFLLKYVFESERERELVHVFRATYDGDVRPIEELDGGRFWSLDELREAFGKGVLTPNFEQEYLKISSLI